MMPLWSTLLTIVLLLLLSAFLSMVEIALVLSRESKLSADAAPDDDALALVRTPDAALSVIQTLATFSAVSIGAMAACNLPLPIHLETWWGGPLIRIVMVGIIAAALLLFGQLVPKRIGLSYPETVLRVIAGPLRVLTGLLSPLGRLFGGAADATLALLRIKPPEAETVSEDDVKQMVREGGKSGALLPEESEMVEAVLGLDRLRVRELMTPRGEIVWLDAAQAPEVLFDQMLKSRHTRFPIHEGRRDNVLGVVSLRDVFLARQNRADLDFRSLAKPAMLVPPTQPVIRLLEAFRSSAATFALVADEFGGISGLITMQDAIEAIIGDFQVPDAPPNVVQRKDGSWLVDASLYFDELLEQFPGFPSDPADERHYVTLNGYILHHLVHIPVTGETFDAGSYRVEVLDLDRNKVDKVLITRLAEPEDSEA